MLIFPYCEGLQIRMCCNFSHIQQVQKNRLNISGFSIEDALALEVYS
ncbi:hypothetical protein N478_20095 [Pseudoalteromonas luteoviolacea S4060-1]|uniref:Uncharacterized protein n=1 Tax=Pseudoalteromonas luteoviolacea S4060-1 TaxID=1365257 RepID=A0A167MG39_9GAMM|nr:hypothetical protein N478_20095 [Pseudoalteromonas luteoviolacea S4060-1]